MAKYERKLTHSTTGEIVLIKSNDYFIFERKIRKQIQKWELLDAKRREAMLKQSKLQQAAELTEEARQTRSTYAKILHATLDINDRIDWNELKDKEAFPEYVNKPSPQKEDFYSSVPKKSWLEILFKPLLRRRERMEAEAAGKMAAAVSAHEEAERSRRSIYEKDKIAYYAEQEKFNSSINSKRVQFEAGNVEAILFYLNLVLERSDYPDGINVSHSLNYVAAERKLVIDMQLPLVDDIVSISEVKYVASKDEFQTKYLSKADRKEQYLSILFQIALRTIHEVFEAEYFGHVQSVDFRGYISGLDLATGNQVSTVVLPVQAVRDNFSQMDLSKVDPAKCVESLGGEIDKVAFDLAGGKKAA